MRAPWWACFAATTRALRRRPCLWFGRCSPAFTVLRPNPFSCRRGISLQRADGSTSSRSAPAFAEPTIYALSTAPGRAAIAVIRISGPACVNVYKALCPGKRLPKPRFASIRSIHEPSAAESATPASDILDAEALVLYFPGPRTVTGEDVLEFHVHGGSAVVKAVLSAIGACSTATLPVRYAEPGEFTRRAFFNDRIDLTQVEALGETLSAVTEEQRRISVQGTSGGLAARYESWRSLLLYARGELEALIDFSEDQHFDESPSTLAASVAAQVRSLENRIAYHCANAMRGELLRNGISISLIGAPNVGKSSLLNLIVGRNAAIVSKEAGTTRDIVEVGVDLGGFFCRFGDTAGLRQPASQRNRNDSAGKVNVVGEIETEGIRRAKEKAILSDLVILVLSIEPSIQGQGANLSLGQEVVATATQLLEAGKNIVVAVNKVDNYGQYASSASTTSNLVTAVRTVFPPVDASRIFPISCQAANDAHESSSNTEEDNIDREPSTRPKDPGNIQALLDGLTRTFKSLTSPLIPEPGPISSTDNDDPTASFDPSSWHESLGATQRQRALLEECSTHLREFLSLVNVHMDESSVAEQMDPTASLQGQQELQQRSSAKEEIDIVVAAESLRAAADCIGRITGRGEAGDVEEVLGVVFEKFCVGK